MSARVDSILTKLKFRGRPLSVDRVTWWAVVILTRLFGREVDLGNGVKQRVFPIVWRGNVHLCGIQHHTVEALFTSEYTLRLRTIAKLPVTAGDVVPPVTKGAPGSVVHLVLGHLAPGPMDRILDYMQELAGPVQVVLAYGGKRENFDQIRFPRKVFIADPRLRGPTHRITFFNLMADARDYLPQIGLDPEWIFLGDYDLLPTRANYLNGMLDLMREYGAGFAGKEFTDVAGTNKLFLTQAVTAGVFDKNPGLTNHGRKAIYHSLGCGFLVHRDCFRAILREKDALDDMYFELALPTAASLHGYRLLSLDLVSTCFHQVRYRPVLLAADALKLAEAGAEFVHPVKEAEAFVNAWSARRAAQATS